MSLESYLGKVKSLWGQRAKKKKLDGWWGENSNKLLERRNKASRFSFLSPYFYGFYLHLSSSMMRSVFPNNGEHVHVELGKLIRCSVKWAFLKQQEEEGRCAVKHDSPFYNLPIKLLQLTCSPGRTWLGTTKTCRVCCSVVNLTSLSLQPLNATVPVDTMDHLQAGSVFVC